jgi:dipeptidyl aminopeptidase/acylaminoacyl peptidase
VSTYGHPGRDRALLEDIAPLASVHRIDVPLLVVHGEHDTNVPVAESRQVVAALRALGRSVEYLELEGEGHVFRRAECRKRLAGAMLRFLTPALDGSGPATSTGGGAVPAGG